MPSDLSGTLLPVAKTTVARAPSSVERDPCVVNAQPLAEMLQSFVMNWERTRPCTTGQFSSSGRADVSAIGAISWLHQETGLPKRTIQRLAAGQRKTTELRVADALVNALGLEHEFSELTGSLQVMPNPRASASARAACCGIPGDSGSLTGSL